MQESSPKCPKILPLPQAVAAQISSSTVIPSLNSVVLGLLQNSLDAHAANVEIAVDLRRASCTVEDDGHGIEANEFAEEGGLGKRFYTSRYHSPGEQYGGQGTFLSSVAALSILTITSRRQNRISQSSLVLHHSRPAARFLKAPAHHSLSIYGHGTRVAVQDLFGNMPVRVKQRHSGQFNGIGHIDREFETLKRAIVALLLSFHKPVHVFLHHLEGEAGGPEKKLSIGVTPEALSNLEENKPITGIKIPLLCKILTHAGLIQPSQWDTWIKASARTVNITIRGAFSLQPAPSKTVQFMSLGIQPLSSDSGHNTLYEEVNKIFALSSFGAQEEVIDPDDAKRSKDRRFKQDGFTNRQLRGRGKGVDRWPMFYLRIDLDDQNDTKKLEREATLNNVIKVLTAVVHGFLKDHHFRPRNVNRAARSSLMSSKKPPSLDRTPLSEDAFSNWSRIKSSNRPESKHSNAKELINRTDDPESATAVRNPKAAIVNSVGEELVEWTNPATKATVLINSRTGLVNSRPEMENRPSTAPAELQHRHGAPRITRGASRGLQAPQKGSWAAGFLSKWENPVFAPPTEEPIPQISQNLDSLDTHDTHCNSFSENRPSTFHITTSTISTRLSKDDLTSARVIGQVDKKYILISITNLSVSNFLLLIDQHAADERIRVEALLHDFHTQPPIPATKSLTFEIPLNEQELFTKWRAFFAHWGITYTLQAPKSINPPPTTTNTPPRLTIRTLPPTLSTRLTTSPPDLISFLRTYLHTLNSHPPISPPSKSTPLPQGISDLLSSRACRSAVMFNDPLTLLECESLVRKLAQTRWPWGCAHGRPSMVGVVDVGGEGQGLEKGLGMGVGGWTEEGEGCKFGEAWKRGGLGNR